eukprot:scpid84822/ scgid13289/ 
MPCLRWVQSNSGQHDISVRNLLVQTARHKVNSTVQTGIACTDITPQNQQHCSNWNSLTSADITLQSQKRCSNWNRSYRLESLVQTVQHKTNITVQTGTKRG